MLTKRSLVVIAFSALFSAPAFAQQEGTINGVGVFARGTRPPIEPVVPGQPLEHREPNGAVANQKPAFPGQTRAPAVVTKTPIEEKIVARGLPSVWGLAFLPNGHILLTGKPGGMAIVTPDGKLAVPAIQNVPAVIYGGDAGMLDVITDPNFASNRTIFFSYVESRPNNLNGTAVASARLSDDETKLENVKTILRVHPDAEPSAHYGCRLLFDKDGKTLFVTLGERFYSPTTEQAQDIHSMMGKILRINPDGTPAKGNPFEKESGDAPYVWSYGHRNPQGIMWNPATGELWSDEHGPQGGDEVNVILPGHNYGWRLVAYGTDYSGDLIGGGKTQLEGTDQPVYYWDPAIAPCGGTFYSGDLIPEWKNNLFIAALAGEHVVRLVTDGHKIIGEERLLRDQRQRIRSVAQGPDGALWVITDDRSNDDARLIRLAPKSTSTASPTTNPTANLAR